MSTITTYEVRVYAFKGDECVRTIPCSRIGAATIERGVNSVLDHETYYTAISKVTRERPPIPAPWWHVKQ